MLLSGIICQIGLDDKQDFLTLHLFPLRNALSPVKITTLRTHKMGYELTLFNAFLLIGAGFFAGIINTIAGGGSMLTLPALMVMGMPADIANGTNRVGILLQSIVGSQRFHKSGKLELSTIAPTLTPTLLGAVLGASLASFMPEAVLKNALLITMLAMALIMLLWPAIVAPPAGTPTYTVKERPAAWIGFFIAGAYGGFIQAGVGFIIIAAVAGGLRYDLVRTNALKMAITAALSLVALIIFLLNGQVLIIPGLILAIGTIAGTMVSVNFSLNVPQAVLKWTMFGIIVLACIAAYLKAPA